MPLAVVLVEPALPENLGAVARVMANFGLQDLRLVTPAADPTDARARAVATHGGPILAAAKVYDDLPAALADRTRVWATTALRRATPTPVTHPRDAARDWRAEEAPALVFGPERTGLREEHLARADLLVAIPTRPEARALNLGQAVAVLVWEWASVPTPVARTGTRARREEVDRFVDRLFVVAERGGMWSEPRLRVRAQHNLRGAVQRAGFSAAELRTLTGVLRAVSRGGPAEEPEEEAKPEGTTERAGLGGRAPPGS